jgi:hypothetical protein
MTEYTYDFDWNAWVDPAYPVSARNAFEWSDVTQIAIHYTAADNLIDGDPGENWANMPAYVRQIQRSYVTSRGYSIGYNVGFDQRGKSWRLRGVTFECAANAGHNEWTIAILCLVDGADKASPEMVAAIRRFVGWARQQAGRHLKIVGHRDIGSTACPGAGLYDQIKSGAFEPQEGDKDMIEKVFTPDETVGAKWHWPHFNRWASGVYTPRVSGDPEPTQGYVALGRAQYMNVAANANCTSRLTTEDLPS